MKHLNICKHSGYNFHITIFIYQFANNLNDTMNALVRRSCLSAVLVDTNRRKYIQHKLFLDVDQ